MILRKALVVQLVSAKWQALKGRGASVAAAFSSIGRLNSIEKINLSAKSPTARAEDSNYWCYIQV
jgi:hypothetical protein